MSDPTAEIRSALVAFSQGSQAIRSRAPRTAFPLHACAQPESCPSTQPPPTEPTRSGPCASVGTEDTCTTDRMSTSSSSVASGLPTSIPGAFLGSLDPSQRAAATYDINAPLIVQAGAGSGKTQMIASRIAYLLVQGVPAGNILGICFTRQAAETLRQRVAVVLPEPLRPCAQALKLKTFHAFGLECLRRFGSIDADTEVYDAKRQRQLACRIVEEHATRYKSTETVDDLVDYINKVKMQLSPKRLSGASSQEAHLFALYEHELHTVCNAVDFGDLLHLFYALLRPVPTTTTPPAVDTTVEPQGVGGDTASQASPSNRQKDSLDAGGTSASCAKLLVTSYTCEILRRAYTHIVVDELQDFNEIQTELLALLAGDACRVTGVGDPNQCIYTWRGALPWVMDLWRRRFPQTALRVLAVNYRSDGTIVDAANRIVQASQRAYHHRLERRVTLIRCKTSDDDLPAMPSIIDMILRSRDRQMTYSDIAVLCRTRRRVQTCLEVLRHHRIPVKELKGISIDHQATARAFIAYLRVCITPQANHEVRQALMHGPSHLSEKVARTLFLSLQSMVEERRREEQACDQAGRQGLSRVPVVGPAKLCPSLPGAHPSVYSYFSFLRELVFHDFSRELFPKLVVSKATQKVLRTFVQVTLQAQEMLARPNCDVEEVIRVVAVGAGFASEGSALLLMPDTPKGRGGSGAGASAQSRKRRRSPPSAAISASVAADYNRTGPHSPTWPPSAFVKTEADDDEDELPRGTLASLTDVLIQTCRSVRRQIGVEEPVMGDATSSSLLKVEVEQCRPLSPVMLLTRTLDEFFTLFPTDSFGPPPLPITPTTTEDGADKGATTITGPPFVCRPLGHVTVGTVHRAKGMEWPAVIVTGCWTGEFPLSLRNEEERRVFYVALSRAMTDLILVTAEYASETANCLSSESEWPPLECTPYVKAIAADLEVLKWADGRFTNVWPDCKEENVSVEESADKQ